MKKGTWETEVIGGGSQELQSAIACKIFMKSFFKKNS